MSLSKKLTLSLLGTPQIRLPEESVTERLSIREQALLYYLAVNGQTRKRSTVASLLWDGVSDQQALKNLRDVLPNLRKRLGDHLSITYQTIRFNHQSLYWLDVEHFQHALGDPQSISSENLRKALDLYRGEFLTDFVVRDASGFNDWLSIQRRHLHKLAVEGWHTLVEHHMAQGEDALALSTVKQLLALEPWRETAHRQAMFLFAHSAQRSTALAQYAVCQQLLTTEFGVAPSAETTLLYEQIKAGTFDQPTETITLRQLASRQLSTTTIENEYPASTVASQATSSTKATPLSASQPPVALATPQVDWNAIPHLKKFYGREYELRQLENWLSEGGCRLGAILGMGGQGKTSLAAKVLRRLAAPNPGKDAFPPNEANPTRPPTQRLRFDTILWQSLLNAPPLNEVLQSWLQQLSNQQIASLPPLLDQQLALLMPYLQRQRVLLVLDNLESTLQSSASEGESGLGVAGAFRPGYEGYQELLRRIGESEHQSCLLLTSREKPAEMTRLEEDTPYVRSLQLEGLAPDAAQVMLQAQGVAGPSEKLVDLAQRYSGNPLALTLIAQTINELFAGDLTTFARQDFSIFGDIRHVLDQQFARLTLAEREILFWLAIEREPITLATLRENLVQPEARRLVFESLRALLRRSLLETQDEHFALQNVVLEYFTERLVQAVGQEIEINHWLGDSLLTPALGLSLQRAVQPATLISARIQPVVSIAQSHLNRFALVKAQAKEYVRESQVRLLLKPLAEHLATQWGKVSVEKRLQTILRTLQTETPRVPGYAGANLLHLLLALEIDVHGYDLSQLTLWQANLSGVELAQVNLKGADLSHARFTELIGRIFTLAFSLDGKLLAAGTRDGAVHVWHTVNRQRWQVIDGHAGSVAGLAFHPDGKRLAVASTERLVRLWALDAPDARHHQPIQIFQSEVDSIAVVAFSPDGVWLAGGADDGQIYLWEVATGRQQTFIGHTNRVVTIAFSPDGQTLASGSYDQTVKLWTVATGEVQQTWRDHRDRVMTVAFSPNGRLLASGSYDMTIRVWDLHTTRLVRHLEQPGGGIHMLAFHPAGRLLATVGGDQLVRLWDLETGQLRFCLPGHTYVLWGVAFHPDGEILASGGSDQKVRLWSVETGKPLYTIHSHPSPLTNLALRADLQQLVTIGYDTHFHRWQLHGTTLEPLAPSLSGHTGQLFTVAFHPAGQLIAAAGMDHIVYLWHVEQSYPLRRLEGHRSWINTVAFSPDGLWLASSSADHNIHLWDVANGQLHYVLQGHTDNVDAAVFYPLPAAYPGARQLLASSSSDETVRFWVITDHTIYEVTELRKTMVSAEPQLLLNVAFSPDGVWLACSVDQVIHLWKMFNDQPAALLTQHMQWVIRLTFSPDSQTLASSSDDRTICLWDIASRQLRHVLNGHTETVNGVAFSLDSLYLFSSSSDGTIKVWDTQTGVCLNTVRPPGPYAGTNITDVIGLTAAQKTTLKALGAVED